MAVTEGKKGWQSDKNTFPQFHGGPEFFQSERPGQGITHNHIPSLMEICLLFEQQLFEWHLWEPVNKKDLRGFGRRKLVDTGAVIYRDRRKFLLSIALFAYDFNEALLSNEENRVSSIGLAISETVKELPTPICDLISHLVSQDFNYVAQDIKDGYRKEFTEEDRKKLSKETLTMLMKNQGICDEESSIRDSSQSPGLFWDLQRCPGGFQTMLETVNVGRLHCDFHGFTFDPADWRDLSFCPTPSIRKFNDESGGGSSSRWICINVLVSSKGDEMWIGVHSQRAFEQSGWPSTRNRVYRTPKHAVYYYGGRMRSIRMKSTMKHYVKDSDTAQDGCWGNIQHDHPSMPPLFNKVHLPYYQSGDWLSFRIDTLLRCYDLFLNNERIVANVDCSDLPMPWVFVTVVDSHNDLIYIEQTTDVCAEDSLGFVDGINYRV